MPARYIIGLIFLLQLAGCAVMRTESVTSAPQGGTVVVERLPPAATPGRPGTAERPLSIDAPGGTVIIEQLPSLPEVVPEVPVAIAPVAATLPETAPPARPVAAAPAPVTHAAAAEKTTAKPPAKVPAPVVRAPLPQKPAAAPARAASTLDLDALEQRLKDTDAIGVFTKIALKNQVDDLLKQIKAYHESNGKPALAQLRQSYDQLLLKVNDVLKNGDPSLASEIMGSREAIWSVLSDPVKFAKL